MYPAGDIGSPSTHFTPWLPTEGNGTLHKTLLIYLTVLLLISGCSTANHGTFVTSTYHDEPSQGGGILLGEVTGESSQTWFLYIFPLGGAPSTSKAIADATAKFADTAYLTDLSIDDRTHWGVGFSHQVISVEAKAYK